MGGKQSKKLVSNRPPPRAPMTGPAPVRMMPKSKKRLIPPDGGWGWMVVLGACISLFFFPSVTVAYGVMFKSHLEAMGAGATEFTIIGNGLSTIWSFAAVFMAPLAELFGARSLTVLGGLLGFLTLILVAFSTSIITFTVVYSILGGISSSLCAFFGVVLIPKYFDKRKGLANGLVVSVSAFGKIVMAPLTRLLLEQYGYRWACLMVGALCLHTCISGMLYQPAEWHLVFRLLDYGLLQEPYFHLIAWPNAIVIAAYVNLMYALPGYVLSLGFSYYQSAFAISAFSVMEVVFRLGIALLSDFSWFPNELVYTSGFVLATVSVGFLTMIPSYEWIVACVAVKGMAMSMIHVNSIHVIVRYLGTDRYAQVIGFFSLLNGVMMVAIGTTADCEQPHVLMTQGGRLGNKLCQYASVYLLRYLYGIRVSIPQRMHDYLSTIFKNITLPAQNTCFTNQTEKVKFVTVYMELYTAASQARAKATDNNIREPLLNASYYVRNNPGPRSLLMAHRDLIRSLLVFREEIVNQAIDNINQALSTFNATYHRRSFSVVTVHVRRTDYTGYIGRKFNLMQLDELYFKKAFEFYKERLPQPVFLVLSDDREWCRRKLQAKDVIVIAKASPTVDMAVMSLGDHHITSYGTYSFSGALLGHGHITHPIGHNTKYNLADCVDSDFFHHISRDKTYKVDNSEVVIS
ncbi:monocarboxylate transporter 2-like isoform X2 [Portunus trituberculatus]|uniref:monocarboxylate transporter 2-like isoform X2 n=1 Tax=Portunus trituberculatus TaxID=210409 RepID=UPI001E1CFBC2|nr:monocarboxylate transporter 2-like isoform X2 [Portunus trituberculatus]